MTEIISRKMPQAVIPPTMGREVTIPDTLPEMFSLYTYTLFRQIHKVITMYSHPYHEEGDEDVDDIQPHQCVLGACKAPTHFV